VELLEGRYQILLVAALDIVVYKVSQVAHLVHDFAEFDEVFVLVLVDTSDYERIKSQFGFA
jgi:hypothetical protein